ncbi:MAG: hypothetical protein SGPRY_008831, partial [Prymnesium sp.]
MVVCLVRHGAREDYAWLSEGRNWCEANRRARVWDPPLSSHGESQAVALGRALPARLDELALPPVTRVVSSPLTRCVQTAAGAANAMGLRSLALEPGLAEAMVEHWYRSWGVSGADSTWGGPAHSRCGEEVEPSSLHPACHTPASSLLLTPHAASALLPACGGELVIDEGYKSIEKAPQFVWGSFEHHTALGPRMGRTIE